MLAWSSRQYFRPFDSSNTLSDLGFTPLFSLLLCCWTQANGTSQVNQWGKCHRKHDRSLALDGGNGHNMREHLPLVMKKVNRAKNGRVRGHEMTDGSVEEKKSR